MRCALKRVRGFFGVSLQRRNRISLLERPRPMSERWWRGARPRKAQRNDKTYDSFLQICTDSVKLVHLALEGGHHRLRHLAVLRCAMLVQVSLEREDARKLQTGRLAGRTRSHQRHAHGWRTNREHDIPCKKSRVSCELGSKSKSEPSSDERAKQAMITSGGCTKTLCDRGYFGLRELSSRRRVPCFGEAKAATPASGQRVSLNFSPPRAPLASRSDKSTTVTSRGRPQGTAPSRWYSPAVIHRRVHGSHLHTPFKMTRSIATRQVMAAVHLSAQSHVHSS